ncbi:putative 28S rRNA (cytosine-C(5))-methyltransferase [Bulinus truncatus]|nr:putative 28S rRNA (cytosine-C(5))-methyltransferase [Bulinus truncatus]
MNTQLYTVAGSILKKSLAKKASLKTLIHESKYDNIPQLTAFVSEFIKHNALLEEIYSHFQNNDLINEEIVAGKKEIALALLYERLLGNRFGKNVALRKVMLRYKVEIKSAVDKVLSAHNVKSLVHITKPKDSKPNIKIPRYMRVNLIHASPEDAIKQLQEEGWNFIGRIDFENFNKIVMSLKEDEFGLDPILFDLLVFPVGTNFYNHHLSLSGILIHQDKASCVPAHVLKPACGSVVLDSCAAPGNKTSHLISLMNDKGEVIAMDQDLKRMNMMSKLLEKNGAKNVKLVHQDFLTVQPDSEDAKRIQFILVDPSCSGSGMLGVQQGRDIYDTDKERLRTLSRFQISILKHALQFPSVERVVYSTCSVHQEENEQVVEQAMSHFSDQFEFDVIFPDFNCNRGLEGYPHSKYFLRLSPENNLTQGFFIACFQRRKKSNGRGSKVNNDTVKINNLDRKRKKSEPQGERVHKSAKVSNLDDNASVDTLNSTVCLDTEKSTKRKQKHIAQVVTEDEQTLADRQKKNKHKRGQCVSNSIINLSDESSNCTEKKKKKHKDTSVDNTDSKQTLDGSLHRLTSDQIVNHGDNDEPTFNDSSITVHTKNKNKKLKDISADNTDDKQTLDDQPKKKKHSKDRSICDSIIILPEEICNCTEKKKKKHKDTSIDNTDSKQTLDGSLHRLTSDQIINHADNDEPTFNDSSITVHKKNKKLKDISADNNYDTQTLDDQPKKKRRKEKSVNDSIIILSEETINCTEKKKHKD